MRSTLLCRALCAAALGLALCAGPCLAAAAGGGDAMKRNTDLLRAGHFRSAMLGFMDMVLQNPGNSSAREYLKHSAEGALKLERDAVERERGALLAAAMRSRRDLAGLAAAKKKRLAAWEKLFSKTRSLASGAGTLKKAVLAYENLLEEAPVYSDNRALFLSRIVELKGVFYRTVKSRYPDLVRGRAALDERDLAVLFFSDDSAADSASRYLNTNQTQRVLDKSDRLRRLEREVLQQYDNAEKGLYFYAKERYADALASLREVLFFDSRNEEARLYAEYAEQRLEQEAEARTKR